MNHDVVQSIFRRSSRIPLGSSQVAMEASGRKPIQSLDSGQAFVPLGRAFRTTVPRGAKAQRRTQLPAVSYFCTLGKTDSRNPSGPDVLILYTP